MEFVENSDLNYKIFINEDIEDYDHLIDIFSKYNWIKEIKNNQTLYYHCFLL